MTEPRWVPREAVLAIHDELLADHGGLRGVRDEAALDASLARPKHKHAYESADVVTLAAAYGFALSRNHAFNDGNKRIALVVIDVFLRLNGSRLVATEVDAAATILALAAGELDELELGRWIERNRSPSPAGP